MSEQELVMGVLSLPFISVFYAFFLQGLTRIACGFVPKYWQAYRVSFVTGVAEIVISLAISILITTKTEVNPYFIAITGVAIWICVQVEIWGRMIKNDGIPIGSRNALIITMVSLLIAGVVAPFFAIIIFYPTIALNGFVISSYVTRIAIGLFLLSAVSAHLTYKIATRFK